MEAEEIRKLISDKLVFVDKKDYFGVLSLDRSATKPQIQKSYFQIVKVLHPDRVARKGLGDVEADAAKVFKFVTEAHSALSDPAMREKYEREQPKSGASTAEIQAQVAERSTQELLRDKPSDLGISAKEAAKIFFHKGAMLMKKGAYADAERFFQRALDADADNARYNLQMGWAVFQNSERDDQDRLSQARDHIEASLKADGENPEAHYYMARLFKEVGQMSKCREHLEAALSKRPNYIEVKRELRLLEMREKRGGAPAKKSTKSAKSSTAGADSGGRWPFGLDKLFKRK